jgi:D-alanyl-D-alanine carboxypeptidase (penicillin-binding protein 5/6)
MLKHVSHVLILAIIALMSVMAVSPFAHGESAPSNTPIIPAPPQLAAEGYLLLDAATGHILVEHNSKQRLPPASLTKIMTSFVAAEEMDRGTLSDNDEVDISVKAWKMEGSRMFIQEGTKVPVELLMKGIIIQSGDEPACKAFGYE